MLVGSRQRPLQSRNPGKQVNVHTPLPQTGSEPSGTGQATQRRPHEAGLESDRQVPSQSWLPGGQEPTQPVPKATHAPPHNSSPSGHCPPQVTPSHVATPPSGTAQGSQETSPQVAGSSFRAHAPPQACVPGEQPSIAALAMNEAAASVPSDPLPPDAEPFDPPAAPGSASSDGGAGDPAAERSGRSSIEHALDIAARPTATQTYRAHLMRTRTTLPVATLARARFAHQHGSVTPRTIWWSKASKGVWLTTGAPRQGSELCRRPFPSPVPSLHRAERERLWVYRSSHALRQDRPRVGSPVGRHQGLVQLTIGGFEFAQQAAAWGRECRLLERAQPVERGVDELEWRPPGRRFVAGSPASGAGSGASWRPTIAWPAIARCLTLCSASPAALARRRHGRCRCQRWPPALMRPRCRRRSGG